jgi:type IV secretion system protein VirD4
MKANISALKNFFSKIKIQTIFTNRYAFWFLTLHLVPAFLAVALIAVGYAWSATPVVFQSIGFLYLPFLGAQVLYLAVSGNWRLFARWLVTRWATSKDRFASVTTNVHLAAQRIGTSQTNGFFLTMEPPSMSSGLKPKKIAYQDDRHVMMIAGSRAGKGRDFIIPNLTHWQGSVIAHDPSGELVAETSEYREKILGQKIIVLDPFGVTDRKSDTWNPMAEIDFDNDPMAVDKCHLLAESLHHEQTPDPFWMHAPRKMLASVIGYVGTRSIMENCHLGMVRDLLMSSDPKALWVAMSQNDALGGVLKRFGEANEHRHIEELNSTMELARTAMKWLDSPVMTQFASSSSFSMKELKESKVTIYIVMPAAMGQAYAAWLRALFNAAFDVMQDASIPKPERDVLFLMDEFPLLGHMERIKRAAGEAAKFGVKLFICAQDITQLKEHYGQAWETFIANAGLLIMFANNDLETQTYLSNRLGKEYYKKHATSKGGNKAHKTASTSTSMELRDVARADQVEWQASRGSGDAFFFIPGLKPMRLPRASYDQWEMLNMEREKQVTNDKPKIAIAAE